MRLKPFATLLLLAMAVVAGAGGCSNAKKDEALTTDIQSKMFADPQIKAANVTVAVKDGEATLSGTVPDDGTRLRAYELASDTPGVKHVTDQMTVQAPQTAQAAPAEPPAPVAPPAAPVPASKASKKHRPKSDADLNTAGSAPTPASSSAPSTAPPAPDAAAAPAPPPPPQPVQVEIPAGTSVRVQMIDSADSAVNHKGDLFHASLAAPIVVDDQIVVPAGTDMYVKLTDAKSAGHMTGQSALSLQLTRMDFQGKSYSLSSNDYQQTGASRGKRTAETVGGGAVLGALLGAVIGHGKGAAIGAAAGAGAGTVAEAATKAQQVKIPSETKLDFALDQPVDISYFPDKNRSRSPSP